MTNYRSRRLSVLETRLAQRQCNPVPVAYRYGGVGTLAEAIAEAVAEQVRPSGLAVALPEKRSRQDGFRMVRNDIPQ
jgi:hypothetical protein